MGVWRSRALLAIGLSALCLGISGLDQETENTGFPAGGTVDAIFGLENSTQAQWRGWHEAMVSTRRRVLKNIGFNDALYADPKTAWSTRTFRQFFLFMYDESFYDRARGRYRVPELLARWQALYGRIDSVLLWQGYPQIGFDGRDQFDFYHQMPGGLEALRTQVTDVLHAHGIRVYLDYNPWDVTGDLENEAHRRSYKKLAGIVSRLAADGVMLDTLTAVPASLKQAVDRARPGVIFSPERRPPDADLAFSRQSWAQWYDTGAAEHASIPRQKWLVPAHQQFTIRRWDTERREDILYSFFNGTGILLWDNVYGTWNPYSERDRRLLRQTSVLLAAYEDFFATGRWLPLVPTGAPGLDANAWELADGRKILVLRNRALQTLAYRLRVDTPAGLGAFTFWNAQRTSGEAILVPPGGVEVLAVDQPAHALAAQRAFESETRAAGDVGPGESEYDTRTPVPQQLRPGIYVMVKSVPGTEFRAIPGGEFTMTIEHRKRETGCYPFGATAAAMWGWYFEDLVTHKIAARVEPFFMRMTAVTNAAYLEFVRHSGYRPERAENFLKQIPRRADGTLPLALPPELAQLPVTYVSLGDARAYARWKGEALPTEEQWQWTAEGAGQKHAFPWGNESPEQAGPERVNLSGALVAADANVQGATPQGVLGLSGNAWEWTESEWSDGHTRFVMVRGGSYLPAPVSEWMIPRAARPNGFHAKYVLMDDSVDRSEAVSFRTVVRASP